MRRSWGAALAAAALAITAAPITLRTAPVARADDPFPDCAPATGAPAITVNAVTCQRVSSGFLGGDVPVSYFVPAACDPGTGAKCPTLYLMHGFGGSYHSMLGTAADPSPWVKALTSGPPDGATESADPWNHSDPAGWVPRPPIDMVLVAPHGRTLPGGFGPFPDLDGYWTDWNPRYAMGGTDPRYATPPPQFDQFLHRELIPYVEAHFPVGAGRDARALTGTSLGGFGSYRDALMHPDQWTSVGSVSGAFNFLFRPWLDPTGIDSPVGVQPPVAVPPAPPVPSLSSALPYGSLPDAAQTYLAATLALGDPNADEAYFRGNTPRDLAANARASSPPDNSQTLYLRAFANDTVPRRPEDFQSPGVVIALAYEDVVLPMNLDQALAFTTTGVSWDFAIHPGLHGEPYRGVWYRGQLEAQYSRVRHADGGGAPTAPPSVFDYRTISTDFTIWGWQVAVDRPAIEFLNLRSVSCAGLTVQGTGSIDVDVPAACGTGVDGSAHVHVDLGPTMPVNEPQGLGATPVYGRTVHIALAPL
jgi:S-formylglutathione hydrolase FrmB